MQSSGNSLRKTKNQQNETQPYRSIESGGSNQDNLGPDDLDDEIPF